MRHQYELLGKTYSWYYYTPFTDWTRLHPENPDMQAILGIHHLYPFYGNRKINQELSSQGRRIGEKRVIQLENDSFQGVDIGGLIDYEKDKI